MCITPSKPIKLFLLNTGSMYSGLGGSFFLKSALKSLEHERCYTSSSVLAEH